MDPCHSPSRSSYQHDDNIEVVDYLEDYINDDDVEIDASVDDDQCAFEIIPLTPKEDKGVTHQFAPKQNASKSLYLQRWTHQSNSNQDNANIVPATAPVKTSTRLLKNAGETPNFTPKMYSVNGATRTPLDPLPINQQTPQTYLPSRFFMSPASSIYHASTSTSSPMLLCSHATKSDSSPSDQSLSTVNTNGSQICGGDSMSSSMLSYRRMPTMSHRSSTSLSLLHGEVISLEPSVCRSSYGNDSDSGSVAQIRRLREDIDEAPQFEPVLDIEEGKIMEGMEIGGGTRQFNSASNRGEWATQFAEFFSYVRKEAMHVGSTTFEGVYKFAAEASNATQRALFHYRFYPVSLTRTKELEDLNFLQRLHKEKLGHLSDNAEERDHFDFVLVLNPQEAYRYWSYLLDFRMEHLGIDDQEAKITHLETASTHSTESCESGAHSEPQNRDLVTPLTGLRRRGKRGTSPPSTARTITNESRPSIATSTFSSFTKRSHARLSMFEKALGYHSPSFKNLFDNSLEGDIYPSPMNQHRPSVSSVRRRWGNRTAGKPGSSNILSPPVRSLTRGTGALRKLPISNTPSSKGLTMESEKGNKCADDSQSEEEIPNPVIPRGVAARTNGLLQFLSALKRGIVVRRHRPNNDAIYCKIFSKTGGDTIQYQMIEAEEAMVAFKEQRIRYNKRLKDGSSPQRAQSYMPEWSFDAQGDGSPVHKFKLPDFIAAKRYREKLMRQHRLTKRFVEFATKAANSGIVRASDIAAVHPARHLDPRFPGNRRGELATVTLRRSKSSYYTPYTFSIVTAAGQPFGKPNGVDSNENKWYAGEGSDLQFKVLDFEAATEGEYWLIFRGFLLLHRDAAVGRFAAERRAGIGGGNRRDREDGEGEEDEAENCLHRNEFGEPVTAGLIEKLYVRLRKLDDSYMKGYVMPGAVCPPSDYFLGFCTPGTQIWSRLRMAGFETQRIYAVDPRRVMIKVRCPHDRLTDVAEVLRVQMQTVDGGYAAFREDAADQFLPRCDPLECPTMYQGTKASLLHSKDRQTIIDFIIGSRIRDSGAELGQTTDLGKVIQARVPLHMHRKLDELFKLWVFWWKRENWTGRDGRSLASLSVSTDAPLSPSTFGEAKDSGDHGQKAVPNCMKRFFVGAFYQPLDDIEEYFGEQVTFYFCWLQHCASHLLVLAAFGLIVTACQLSSNNMDHPIRPFFAVVIMLWTFIVLVNWRKRSNFLAYRWGTMNYEVQETTRPEFFGVYVTDEVTNEWIVKYPKWKRWLKYLISFPVSVIFTGLAMLLILLVHANRDLQIARYVQKRTHHDAEPYEFELSLKAIRWEEKAPIVEIPLTRDLLLDSTFWLVMGALPAMLGLCIPIMNLILMKISVMLNNFENYRTESEYRSHLIIKVFSFRFVSQFGTLYYYAAISTGSPGAIENGLLRMGTSLLIYTTVSHWWTIFLQVYFFMLVKEVRRWLYRRKLMKELRIIELEEEAIACSTLDSKEEILNWKVKLMNRRTLLDQAQDDVWFEIMNNAHDSFPEYITAVVQFSFVACFSVVLPITPLLCLFNYLLSMRCDAYKLCRGRRRPLAQKTGGIGVWEHLLHIVAVIAVLTNCWLMVFTNADIFTWLTKNVGGLGIFAIVVAWEHVMLLIKYVMHTTISPLPRSVRDELKKKNYRMERQRHRTMRTKKDRRSQHHESGSQSRFSLALSHSCDESDERFETPDVLRTIPSSDEESSGLYSA